jgi:hypothetical protein
LRDKSAPTSNLLLIRSFSSAAVIAKDQIPSRSED